jgi:hypothetical protein
MSTNAVAVDFMEMLHPLIAMNKSTVENNGLYDAAATFLGTTDLTKCKVFYPQAENAPMFDSLLVAPDNKRYIMISSKGGSGALPSATGMTTAMNTLVNNANNVAVPKNIQARINSDVTNQADYVNLVRMFKDLGSKAADSYSFRSSSVQEVADLLRSVHSQYKVLSDDGYKKFASGVMAKLNGLDNGKFLEFCTTIMNCTNLVQINSYYQEKDPVLVVDKFLATWPNTLYDNILFTLITTRLHFKINLGGADNADVDLSQVPGLDSSGKKTKQPRFTSYDLINTLMVPGSKGVKPSRKEDVKWSMFIKDLYEVYQAVLKVPEFLRADEARSLKLPQSYKAAQDFQSKHGFDPTAQALHSTRDITSGDKGMTTQQLLDAIKELV